MRLQEDRLLGARCPELLQELAWGHDADARVAPKHEQIGIAGCDERRAGGDCGGQDEVVVGITADRL